MTQTLKYWINDIEYTNVIPSESCEVIDGVVWGNVGEVFSPAYWLSQYWMYDFGNSRPINFNSTGSLLDETIFCLLGGFGITAELALAAFSKCKQSQLIESLIDDTSVWSNLLKEPLLVGERLQRYRCPNQKAKFITEAIRHFKQNNLNGLRGKLLRDELLKISGIGLKTAGWITRNFDNSDEIAIIDIHLIRACKINGIFKPHHNVEKDYLEMEDRFIAFCKATETRPALMDWLMWDQMRFLGKLAINAYNDKKLPHDRKHPKQSEQLYLFP